MLSTCAQPTSPFPHPSNQRPGPEPTPRRALELNPDLLPEGNRITRRFVEVNVGNTKVLVRVGLARAPPCEASARLRGAPGPFRVCRPSRFRACEPARAPLSVNRVTLGPDLNPEEGEATDALQHNDGHRRPSTTSSHVPILAAPKYPKTPLALPRRKAYPDHS